MSDIIAGTNNSALVDSVTLFARPITEIDTLTVAVRIPDLFERFIASLPNDLAIRRGAFALAHDGCPETNSTLSIIAIGDEEQICAGLGIAVPQEKSMLQEICDTRCLKTITPASNFHGNFVERRALIVSQSGCLGMYPLAVDDLILGALTLNCDNHAAFKDHSTAINDAIEALCVNTANLELQS